MICAFAVLVGVAILAVVGYFIWTSSMLGMISSLPQ
jgi:hypothetical protein